MCSKQSLFASQSPPWNDPEDIPMSGNATCMAEEPKIDAKHFKMMRTADLLKIMASEETSQEDREAAYKIVEESLQKTGLFGF